MMNTGLQKQQGVVLALSLIILLAMTLVAVSGMRSTALDEKMALNMRDKEVSYQSAESALIEGEWLVNGFATKEGVGNVYAPNGAALGGDDDISSAAVWWNTAPVETTSWWTANGAELTNDLDTAIYPEQPRYIVEYYGSKPDSLNSGAGVASYIDYYRVTGWGKGSRAEEAKRPATVSIHQTTYAQRF